ncbi:hypothetical protein AB0A81_39210 [Streptomyces flaveolus]|uniref:Uncharacterized protein n=1 Tax=Streptomyces flaveolus TaxID=67297 RepID=A0ABV1VIH6_9ACTN
MQDYGAPVPAGLVIRAGADRLNAWRPTDPVAIGCPLVDYWPDAPTDLAVVDVHDQAHDIVKYPATPRGGSIDDRVTA